VLILAQRLVRRLCPECKQPDELSDERLDKLGLDRSAVGDHQYYKASGCVSCHNRGYVGRIAVFELLVPTPEIREMIAANKPAWNIKQEASAGGMRTLRSDAMIKARRGITSLDEVMRTTPE